MCSILFIDHLREIANATQKISLKRHTTTQNGALTILIFHAANTATELCITEYLRANLNIWMYLHCLPKNVLFYQLKWQLYRYPLYTLALIKKVKRLYSPSNNFGFILKPAKVTNRLHSINVFNRLYSLFLTIVL